MDTRASKCELLASQSRQARETARWENSKARAAGETLEGYQNRAAAQRAWKQKNPSYRAGYLRKYRETARGKEVVQTASRRQKARKRDAVLKHKAAPCLDCQGIFHPEAMEFDHREPADKSFSIASFGRRVGLETLETELLKCDLVCANCHRVRTARRREGLPAVLPPPEYVI